MLLIFAFTLRPIVVKIKSRFIWDKTGYSKPKNRPVWIMVPTLILVLALISLAFIWPNLENLLAGIAVSVILLGIGLSYNIGRFYLYAILTLAFSISVWKFGLESRAGVFYIIAFVGILEIIGGLIQYGRFIRKYSGA